MTDADVERLVKPSLTGHQHLDHLLRQFVAGNVMAAWRALWWARIEEIPAPEWVLQYFENVASNLLDLTALDNAQSATDAAIVAALGLKTPGRGTAMSRDRLAIRDSLIVRDVAMLTESDEKLSGAKAHQIVSKRWGMSPNNVKSICAKRRQKTPPT
jgi:hypothetical protein